MAVELEEAAVVSPSMRLRAGTGIESMVREYLMRGFEMDGLHLYEWRCCSLASYMTLREPWDGAELSHSTIQLPFCSPSTKAVSTRHDISLQQTETTARRSVDHGCPC